MSETVFCVKTKKEGERLDRQPFPNELGRRIYESISKEAWQLWIAHSTMLVNEYRIAVGTAQGREFLLKQCEEFFFGEGSELPPDFKPIEEGGSGDGNA
jgi:Fe-S cluster biosynthesis and repair protein YggX